MRPVLEHRMGDLFEESLTPTIFVQACNCEGRWGRGVAEIFKERFPEAFETQKRYCSERVEAQVLGTALLWLSSDGQHHAASIFTKRTVGGVKSQREILEVRSATKSAIQNLLEALESLIRGGHLTNKTEIRMPKINSGLFQVPWESTLKIVEEAVSQYKDKNPPILKLVIYTR